MTHFDKAHRSFRPIPSRVHVVLLTLLATGAVCFFLDELLIACALWVSVSILALRGIVVGLRRANAVIDGAWALLGPPNESSQTTTPEKRSVSG